MSDMSVALELLGVGMITVFVILSLVVILGQLIIRFVNRFMPEVEKVVASGAGHGSEIHPKKVAAIVSAVKTITNGTGRVTKIDRM